MSNEHAVPPAPEEFVPDEATRVPVAPAGKRYVGYCRGCHDFVEMSTTFTCMEKGHPKDDIAVALLVDTDEPRPHLPRMNWGALFMPAIWGPGHGQWFMILFYPLWLVLDNLIYGAVHGGDLVVFAVVAAVAAAAFTIYYARHANEFGYLRVAAEKSVEDYLKTERVWAVAMVVVGVAFLAFATWYNIAVRPGLA